MPHRRHHESSSGDEAWCSSALILPDGTASPVVPDGDFVRYFTPVVCPHGLKVKSDARGSRIIIKKPGVYRLNTVIFPTSTVQGTPVVMQLQLDGKPIKFAKGNETFTAEITSGEVFELFTLIDIPRCGALTYTNISGVPIALQQLPNTVRPATTQSPIPTASFAYLDLHLFK